MKADYVHKDTLTATDYVELNKNNELLMIYNQALLKENQELKAELQLYQGALKRENEAIHRVNDLEKVIDEAIKRLEKGIFIIPKDTNELLDILKGENNE